ncbi:hypothetical protein [Roseicella frigidaeris]|uniref:Entericidin EcnAB n=1 Tax=Roseicella frigidaeris TaxID=2230885 RepID=A0A327LW78_9PROT|nr:hypothetical protein [Roseicella frigidaeris]RAI54062.1 hypothetical protein DOO78_26680 [Roseicella frigidaeris]
MVTQAASWIRGARRGAALLGLLALAALPGCESRKPATQTGEALDRAGTATGAAIDRAATATGGAMERTGEWVRRKTE